MLVVDSDLEGSCGLDQIHKAYPEIFISGGIMERGNLSAAAGFGMAEGKQGVFATFAAFLEMCISEITMARLNYANLLCHFSHSGIDDMADNTCHFGINNMFADNGLDDGYETKLYFPADPQPDEGLRQEGVPRPWSALYLLDPLQGADADGTDGQEIYGGGYTFIPGKDEIVREGTDGYIVSFGDGLYRALDAVERLKQEGSALA